MSEAFFLLDREFRLLDVNRYALALDGRAKEELVGRTLWKLTPGLEASELGQLFKWVMLHREERKATHRQEWQDGHSAWLESRIVPVGGGVAAFYRDVSAELSDQEELRESEALQRFLLELGDRAREIADPKQIVALTTQALGERLKASRVLYTDIDDAAGRAAILPNWTADGVDSLPPEVSLDVAGEPIVERLRRGETLCVNDTTSHPDTAGSVAFLDAFNVRALISVPLMKDDRLVANLNVHKSQPHAWTAGELLLVQTVAERTWEAMQRRAAEEALRRERDRTRAVLDNMDAGYLLVDRDFRVLEINPAGLTIEERPAEEIVGKIFWDAWPGVEESEAGRLWKEAMTERVPRSFEHRYEWPNGKWKWLALRAFPADSGLAFFFSDVSERKSAEAELTAREAHLSAMFAQAAAGMSETDAKGRFLRVNDRFCAITGRTREELLSLRMHDITHPDDLPGNAPLFDRAAEAGTPFEIEKRYVRPDGSTVWVHNSVTMLREATGEFRTAVCVTVDIEDRKSIENALRASNGRFLAAIEATNGVLWTNDPEGRMVGEQPGWASLTGQGFEEYQGYGWSSAVHPDDVQPTIDAWNEAVVERKTFVFEHRVQRRDGQWRLFAIRAIPILDSIGAVTEWVGVHTDITEQRAAQEALREETRTLETLNHTGEALAAELDLERVVQTVTDAGVELTGAAFGAFFYNVLNEAGESYMLYTLSGVDRSEFERFPMPRATAVFKPTFDGEGVIRSEDILKDARYGHTGPHHGMPKGHLPVRSYLAVPVASRSGEVVGGLFFGHPEPGRFTERHERLMVGIAGQAAIAIDNARLFKAVQRSNETLEQRVTEALAERRLLADIIDGTDVFVQVVDQDYNWLAINKASAAEFARIFNVRRPTAGDNMLEMLRNRPADQAAVQAVWSRALAGEEFVEVDAFGDPENNRRHYEMRFRTLRGAQGETIGAYQFVHDVTDRVKEQIRLEEAEAALRQAQKMEAMGQLTGGVAHDFNNLLTPIVGSLDMLQRKGIGGEREQRLIAGAVQSAERAKTLVQRLLAFARRQPLQPVPVDVGKLVHGMADLLASTMGPQIRLVVETAEDLPPATADPNQLEMALLNLGVNARDAMPDGGTLRLTATTAKVAKGHHSGAKPGQYVCLSVADSGTGMDEVTLARAVEPFFSTKGIGKGTGLGLSMAHGLASQLGGALTIQSRLGVGTNIELWLPVSEAPATAAAERSDAVPMPDAKGTALLVDDEDLVRMSTADMLGDLGYTVIEAGSAEEALSLLRSGLSPDLLVTDHLMPGMNGTELARAVRLQHPEIQVLIVSGYAEGEGVAPDLPRLTKPFRSDELAACLREARY
jgi:PAS domain S-box-containing protein